MTLENLQVDIAKQLNEIQLVDVQLHSVSFQKRLDVHPPSDGALPRWKLDYGVQFRLTPPGELQFKLRGQMAYAEEETYRPFDLAVELVGVYKADSPIEHEQIPTLLWSHSAPLLWPYMREVISDITTRAGGPAFVIPTLKVTSPLRQKAKSPRKAKVSREAEQSTVAGTKEPKAASRKAGRKFG